MASKKRKKTAPPVIKRRTPRPNRSNGDATRQKILDAAEFLFAEHGYSAVSLRSITARAGVNVAAIHFHFASKEALFEALFDRRVSPINAARVAALDALVQKAPDSAISVEQVIEEFIKPHLMSSDSFDAGRIVMLQFMARVAAENDPDLQAFMNERFFPPWRVLVQATKRALPDIAENEVSWGLFFLLGALYYVNPSRRWLTEVTQGKCDVNDTRSAYKYLVPFLAGGLRALRDETKKNAKRPGR
ncbi:MAG: TetR family transcriptional regulator [Pseudolabrys sp.]|nr:TetR family transcriptional regulator [Pseudolabrys sp.]